MHSEKGQAIAIIGAGLGYKVGHSETLEARGHYQVECHDADGKLQWADDIENLVTTEGKNDALDKYLAGSTYTAAWYIGLISSVGFGAGPVAGDTSASHAGWTEDQNYSQSTRIAAAFSAAASGSKALSAALVYSITAAVIIKGCFLISGSAKGGIAGILYSAGLFSNGDKTIGSGDTLTVSYTASL